MGKTIDIRTRVLRKKIIVRYGLVCLVCSGSTLRLTLPFNLAPVCQQVLGSCGPGVGRSFSLSYIVLFLCSCWCEPKVCLCFHAVWARVLGLLQCCLPGFVVCWWCLFLSLFTLLFLSSLLSPHPVHQTLPAYLMLGCWYFGLAPPQLSPSTLPPFSTPPAPSPANGPPSPKFGRDPLSYCLKEINKTVKPRISSFRTLRRSVSHQRKRFGWQETSSHQGLHIILSLLQKDVLNSSDK